ncbi:MAG TPA: thiamine phosphate synthase [Actinomycetota bacterium]|nr:thiamine phosphate synthase [Actinomycetota bacterium]
MTAPRLRDARLYLVAPQRIRAGRLAELVPELAAAGVDLVQLREPKDAEGGDLVRAADPVAAACRAAGVPFVVNDRPDVALAVAAGVHVGQNDVSPEIARRIVGDAVVGISTHAPEEVDAALRAPVDYLAVGPVFSTPTKPGRRATGVELLRHAAGRADRPWFAIGGIDAGNVGGVLDAGARRVVVVRAIADAADPVAAAAALRGALDERPLDDV